MTVRPEGLGLALYLVCVTLLVLSYVFVILRCISRRLIKSLGVDDCLMVVGLLLFTVSSLLLIWGTYHGIGAKDAQVSQPDAVEARKLYFVFTLSYVASTLAIKASICELLLRISTERWQRWTIMGIGWCVIIAGILTEIIILVWCHPISASWNEDAEKCWDPWSMTATNLVLSLVRILTDGACAVFPVVMLWNVQLKTRIKGPIILILSLAALPSLATIIRLKYIVDATYPTNNLYTTAHIALWSTIETSFGLIASSLAALRPLIKRLPWLYRLLSRSAISHEGNSIDNHLGRELAKDMGNRIRGHHNHRSPSPMGRGILDETVSERDFAAAGGDEHSESHSMREILAKRPESV